VYGADKAMNARKLVPLSYGDIVSNYGHDTLFQAIYSGAIKCFKEVCKHGMARKIDLPPQIHVEEPLGDRFICGHCGNVCKYDKDGILADA
jgi:hypothetical protein